MPTQDAGHDLDLVVLGERLAQLGQQVRGRLDSGPVVLVEDQHARAASTAVLGGIVGAQEDVRGRAARAVRRNAQIHTESVALFPAA